MWYCRSFSVNKLALNERTEVTGAKKGHHPRMVHHSAPALQGPAYLFLVDSLHEDRRISITSCLETSPNAGYTVRLLMLSILSGCGLPKEVGEPEERMVGIKCTWMVKANYGKTSPCV